MAAAWGKTPPGSRTSSSGVFALRVDAAARYGTDTNDEPTGVVAYAHGCSLDHICCAPGDMGLAESRTSATVSRHTSRCRANADDGA
jgi:hypothetical protein